MTETIIDTCHAPDVGTKEKPRTKAIRRALRQQLQYIRRNLETIRSRYGSDLTRLSRHQYRSLLVVSEVYRQQRKMYDEKTHSVSGRIVNPSQPHVRPIVRGKTAAPVEFGAKISAAKVGDFAYLDRLSWDAYNQAHDLPRHVEAYRYRFGGYPKTVHADAIYGRCVPRFPAVRSLSERGRIGATARNVVYVSAGHLSDDRRRIRHGPNGTKLETMNGLEYRLKAYLDEGRRGTHSPGLWPSGGKRLKPRSLWHSWY